MEKNNWLKNWMENSPAYAEHLLYEQIIFSDIGKNVRVKVEFLWINDIDNRINIEEEDLRPNFDGRRVLWINCLQGLQRRTTPSLLRYFVPPTRWVFAEYYVIPHYYIIFFRLFLFPFNI